MQGRGYPPDMRGKGELFFLIFILLARLTFFWIGRLQDIP